MKQITAMDVNEDDRNVLIPVENKLVLTRRFRIHNSYYTLFFHPVLIYGQHRLRVIAAPVATAAEICCSSAFGQ